MTAKTDKIPSSLEGLSNLSITNIIDDVTRWLGNHYLELIFAIGIGIAVFVLLGGLKRLAARYIRKNDSYVGYRVILLRAISKTSRLFRFMVAAELVAGFSNAPEGLRSTVYFLFTITTVVQVAIWVREIILGFFSHRLSSDPEQHETLKSAMTLIKILVSFVIFAIATIVILDNLGVDVTGLVAGLGVGGIAIGLAAQGIFSDLFAALSIIFDKPFKHGDVIHYGTTTGTVEKIGLKSTRIRTATGDERIISNTNLLGMEITNFTRMQYRRQRLAIGVIYQTSPDDARRIPEILKEIIESHGARFVRSGFVGFGDSSIDFQVDFDFDDIGFDTMYQGTHAIGLSILQRFNDEGYEFAYPTQTSFTAAPDGEMVLPYPAEGFPIKIEDISMS